MLVLEFYPIMMLSVTSASGLISMLMEDWILSVPTVTHQMPLVRCIMVLNPISICKPALDFFASQSSFRGWTSTTASHQNVAIGDVDGDGSYDIFECNLGVNRLFLQKNGSFVEAVTSDLFSFYPQYSLEASCRKSQFVDLDRDGDVDLLWIEASGHRPRLFENQQGLLKEVSNRLTKQPFSATDFVLADINRDGYLDLLITSTGAMTESHGFLGDHPLFLYNLQNMQFADFTSIVLPLDGAPLAAIYSAAMGDIDGDGNLDLIMTMSETVDDGTTHSTEHIYFNMPLNS